jgi:hypothetical protein
MASRVFHVFNPVDRRERMAAPVFHAAFDFLALTGVICFHWKPSEEGKAEEGMPNPFMIFLLAKL